MSSAKVAENKKATVMIEWNGRVVARAGHLRNLLHDCVTSRANEQALRLVEAARLLLRGGADVAAVRAMVACGAYESAACVMLGPDRPFLLSRGANGVCLASILAAGSDGEIEQSEATGEAASPALAIVAALASTLLVEEGRATNRIEVPALTNRMRLH